MSKRFRIRKRAKGPNDPVHVNITPMVDMFSVLNSFLLMAAVFWEHTGGGVLKF